MASEQKIPKRLRREPLIEVIWQAIFDQPTQMPPGDVLVGIIYVELRKSNTAWRFHRLPTAEIPPSIAEQDPNLRYAVKYRIESPEEQLLYQVGDRIISVNCRRPYVGWEKFKKKILALQDLLHHTGLISGAARHALRYIDLIPKDDMPDLNGLRLALKIGDQEVLSQPLQLRIEIPYQGQNHILQIVTPARVQLPQGQQEGTLIDLETRAVPSEDWSKRSEQLEALHCASKAMFFEQVLKPETIEQFEPEY